MAVSDRPASVISAAAVQDDFTGEKKKPKQLFEYAPSDSSVYPSYTNLCLPYRVICRQRYQKCIRDQQLQFIKEIQMHEELQPQALNGVRLHREYCNPILKKVGTKDMIKLTLAEERRVEFLMKTDPRDL